MKNSEAVSFPEGLSVAIPACLGAAILLKRLQRLSQVLATYSTQFESMPRRLHFSRARKSQFAPGKSGHVTPPKLPRGAEAPGSNTVKPSPTARYSGIGIVPDCPRFNYVRDSRHI